MLEEHLKRMLLQFQSEIKAEKWFGKEKELKSRFAVTILAQNIGCCEQFQHPGQIGIDVRVKQIKEEGKRQKPDVAKDLIIWQTPHQTVWHDDHVPLCIIEWKDDDKSISNYDINWLKSYTARYPGCFGIAVNVGTRKRDYQLQAALIKNGELIDKEWINE